MKISHDDEGNLHRLLDGELLPEAAVALRARIAAEPALAARFRALEGLRSCFAGDRFAGERGSGAPLSAGFTAGVLAAARRLPSRHEMDEQEVGDGVIVVCRRLLLAAAVVVAFGLVWRSGVIGRVFEVSHGALEAESSEMEQEIQRLDALIQSGAIGERSPK
ncbi:MAG: hypothetical protein JNK78_03515 [Planctomycetes bacterium]|nr:hypothetical protein [Planctomycetota bacterium]